MIRIHKEDKFLNSFALHCKFNLCSLPAITKLSRARLQSENESDATLLSAQAEHGRLFRCQVEEDLEQEAECQ